MKKQVVKGMFKMSWLLLLALLIGFAGCDKDDDDDNGDDNPPVIILDGIYIRGAATPFADYDEKGMLSVTRNEVVQEERESLYEIYMALKAGEEFNISKVAGAAKTTYGPGPDFGEVAQGTQDEPKVTFWRGTYTEAAKAGFTVPNDGLYHVALDTELEKIVIVPVEYWGLIGAATPGGWSDDTQMMPEGFDQNSITFKVTDVEMTKADFKFRYSGGWKVELDTTLDIGNGNVGVKVNTNYGNAVNDLVPGGDNINNDVAGVYTAMMVWTLGEGYEATVTKTGDLPAFDYSNTALGLVGDGLVVNGNQHNWDETIEVHIPDNISGTDYTWNWNNIEVMTGADGFKIREGQDWNGVVIGYPQVTMAGSAAGDFDTNPDGNFMPQVDGVYNFTLLIEAATETYTVTVEPAK